MNRVSHYVTPVGTPRWQYEAERDMWIEAVKESSRWLQMEKERRKAVARDERERKHELVAAAIEVCTEENVRDAIQKPVREKSKSLARGAAFKFKPPATQSRDSPVELPTSTPTPPAGAAEPSLGHWSEEEAGKRRVKREVSFSPEARASRLPDEEAGMLPGTDMSRRKSTARSKARREQSMREGSFDEARRIVAKKSCCESFLEALPLLVGILESQVPL